MDGDICGSYDVLFDGRQVGKLVVAHEGLMLRFRCSCRLSTREILRMAVRSGGEYLVLGVLLPDGEFLHFDRRFTRADLAKRGLAVIEDCRLIREGERMGNQAVVEEATPDKEAGWRPEPCPWTLFLDEDLQRTCQSITGALVRETPELLYFAIPFGVGRPFPAMPIFCFGEAGTVQGNEYLIFKIKNGILVG